MAFVKVYGKILGYILVALIGISTTIISARAVQALNEKEVWRKGVEERLSCMEKGMLTREDVRGELKTFKLDLIESGMIIVPARNK